MTDTVLKRLFMFHRRELQSYLTGKLRDPDLAADLTQDIYIRCAERPDPAQPIASGRSYLFRMAHNLAIDHLRARHRAGEEQPEVGSLDYVADEQPASEAVIAARQRLELFRTILSELPERTQAIFLLNRVEQLSYAEVAAKLHISESSVQKHLAKALAHLTRRMRALEGRS